MSTELEELHLADLHERAAEAGISGYRLMRRDELIAALSGDGEEEPAQAQPAEEPEAEEKPRRRRRGRRRRKPEPEAGKDPESESDTDEMAVVEATVLDDSAEEPVELEPSGAPEADLPTEGVTGVLELTRQRYGFIRLSGLAPTDGDVYISAAQVRRCELQIGRAHV